MSSQLSLPEALGQGNLKWQEGGDGFLRRGGGGGSGGLGGGIWSGPWGCRLWGRGQARGTSGRRGQATDRGVEHSPCQATTWPPLPSAESPPKTGARCPPQGPGGTDLEKVLFLLCLCSCKTGDDSCQNKGNELKPCEDTFVFPNQVGEAQTLHSTGSGRGWRSRSASRRWFGSIWIGESFSNFHRK